MWRQTLASLVALSAGFAATSACAVSAPPQGCTVVDAVKLPPSAGGAETVCRLVEKAVAERAPGVRYTAEVKVVSRSLLSARLTANGRELPEQNFAVSDRDLNPVMIERFAQSIAEVIRNSGDRRGE